MPSILSTKRLTHIQRETFRKAGIQLVEYDAIKIENVDFKMPEYVENAIFTSKNAVQAVVKNSAEARKIKNSFCVGSKTGKILSKNGLKPLKIGHNAADLGQFIAKYHSEKSFYFFCGDKRREELPIILENANIPVQEVITYKTVLNPEKFNQDFNTVLFFSPSGIQSFVKNNDLSQKTAICIGKTTAFEAKKHTEKVEIAVVTTVESVIEKAIELTKRR
ncbi:uroporphyrinogen-III synthase [Flavimarina sp. Hel_I_48]|uniref:uroporphyrinogen-III synthase n=1 Tax=Flavimarina sp. Hel_I_48 TaxID=1392488 RepID=UPI0004DF17D5|nr:uroporphyrinogen-III synthase [Flavimarina sp. Hel_I_48]